MRGETIAAVLNATRNKRLLRAKRKFFILKPGGDFVRCKT
jgi:hypothetical protein